MTADLHAEHRRRLYQAMLDHPEGITSEDFATTPCLDGGERIPRVAPRIHELRADTAIPLGLRRGSFALYRLAATATVTDIAAREPRHLKRHGFDLVAHCHGCLSQHPPGFVCPRGHLVAEWLSGSGPQNDQCTRNIIEREEQRAA